MSKKYKPFDLEAAKAGEPVCTRDGRAVRILCFDRVYMCEETDEKEFPIVALVKDDFGHETTEEYTIDGQYSSSKSPYDLMMPPKVREYWVNVYKSIHAEKGVYTSNLTYSSKEDAEYEGKTSEDYLNTVLLYTEEV